MTRLRPTCAGSAFYGPHHVSVEHGYTVITPGGTVVYCCDTDCLQRTLEARAEANASADRPKLRRICR